MTDHDDDQPAKKDGYLPLSRGLREHMRDFPATAFKFYLFLLFDAPFKGKHRGEVVGTLREIADAAGLGVGQVHRASRWLNGKYVDYHPATSRHSLSLWKIQRFKGTYSDFSIVPSAKRYRNDNPSLPFHEQNGNRTITERYRNDNTTQPSDSLELVNPEEQEEQEEQEEVIQNLPPKSAADPRHDKLRGLIQESWKAQNPTIPTCPWNGRTGAALKRLLCDNPSWAIEQFAGCLANRIQSEVNPADIPAIWIPQLPKYAAGPLDRFNQPLQVLSKTELASRRTHANIAAAFGKSRSTSGGDVPR